MRLDSNLESTYLKHCSTGVTYLMRQIMSTSTPMHTSLIMSFYSIA